MTDPVFRKIDVTDHASPPGTLDHWQDFRIVERLNLELNFSFSHSLGKLSRFFVELERKRLLATRCPHCGKTWLPPRVHCPDDLYVAEWVEVSQHGTLEMAVTSQYSMSSELHDSELVFGYIRMDGVNTAIFQQIKNCFDPHNLDKGRRMKVVWAEDIVEHPIQLFWFEIDGGGT